MKSKLLQFLFTISIASIFIFSCGTSDDAASSANVADSIYYNGTILTMNDAQKEVESVATKDGKIVFVGTMGDLESAGLKGSKTKMIDLDGKTMLPGFVDPHSHVFVVGMQYMAANLYPPPDGTGGSILDVLAALQAYYETNPKLYQETGYIVGSGYDNAQLHEKTHPTKFDLDTLFPDKPVYIMHQSGHIGVANSLALEMIGINADSPNPPGGVIQRVAGTDEPNGVLEEIAHFVALGGILSTSESFSFDMLEQGLKTMAGYGYTTVQEGRAGDGQIAMVDEFAKTRGLDIDIVIFPDMFSAPNSLSNVSKTYEEGKRYRIGGAKISLDGSPQGKTAWRDTPYVVPPEGQSADYMGYPAYPANIAMGKIVTAFENGWPLQAHANGEAAIELFIDSVEAAITKYGTNDYRPVLVHGQFLKKNQVARIKELNIFPSLFPMHTYYWGDWHSEQTIGEPGVKHISPTGWIRDEGMIYTIHHDAPIVPPDNMTVVWTAVNRQSREGRDIGRAEQGISVYDALKATTIWSAYQLFEEDSKGSIEVGKLADFVVLTDNPLLIDPMRLREIDVVQTIKEDKSIYTNNFF